MTSGGEARGTSLGFRDGCGMRRAPGRLKLGLYSVIGLLWASGKLGEEIFVNNAAGCGGGSERKWKFHSLLSHWCLRMKMPVCNKCFVDLEGGFFLVFFAAWNEIFLLIIFLKWTQSIWDFHWREDEKFQHSMNGAEYEAAHTPPLRHHTVQNKGDFFFCISHRKETHERM